MRLLLVLLGTAALQGATVVSFERQGNVVRLGLDSGSAEIEWMTDAVFRYSMDRKSATPVRAIVPFTVTDPGAALQIRTRYVIIDVVKAGFRLRVRTGGGEALMEETAGPERTDDGIRVERQLAPAEHIYGLGARTDASLDARGSRILSSRPFFFSSAGYGQYFTAGKALFDVGRTAPGRFRITSPGGMEYYFYYGPTPKDIFEQHFQVAPAVRDYRPTDFEVLAPALLPSYATLLPPRLPLAEAVRALVHSSLSAMAAPAIDLDAYPGDPRAEALAPVVPVVLGKRRAIPLRESLHHYHIAYIQEARDRGFPLIHALPVQFPSDAEAPEHNDEFMFGDELLAAPFTDASPSRRVYLPMGLWTELATNVRHKGRQVIEVSAKSAPLPLFAKNGSVVPFQGLKDGDPVSLHYFPNLGGEFFVYEVYSGETSQFHASPATGYYRLEIESKETRLYEWVVHHVPAPLSVMGGGKNYRQASRREDLTDLSWCYDAQAGNLHVRLEARAGEDRIVNVKMPAQP